MHHTKEKGDLGVLKVQADLAMQGFMILHPLTEHAPFDLVGYKNGEFYRIQVKFRKKKKGVLSVPLKSSWTDKNGNHIKLMDKGEVDYVAVYCPDNDECYYFNPKDFGNEVSLRIDTSLHGQNNVHYASCYRELGKVGKVSLALQKSVYKPHFGARKVDRPDKDVLNKMLWEKPSVQIAKELGVSDSAIKKWARCYGLLKPGRGYWAKIKFGRIKKI